VVRARGLLALGLAAAACCVAAAPAAAEDAPVFYVRTAALSPEPIAEFAGLPGRVLSRNTGTGRLALELQLPAGFRDRGARAAGDRSFEVVVLDGQLQFGKETLGPRDFGYMPAGLQRPKLATAAGARLLAFFDPAPGDPAVRTRLREIGGYVTRYAESRWNPGSLSQMAGFDLRLEIQHLKKDPLSGARTWLVRLAPPVKMPFEVHSVAEEAYVLAGRFSQPECMPDGMRTGIYEANSYFYRPGGIPHSGPGAGPIEQTTFLMRSPGNLDVIFYSACANAVATQRVSTDATARREITEFLQRWVQLRNAGRWDDLAAQLADDPRFAWVEFGRVSMGSHAVAVAELARARGRPAQTFTGLSDVVVDPLTSELALVRGNFKIRAVNPAESAGRPGGIDRDGVFTATLIFRERRWQFLQVNFSQAKPESR
jgi:hypothetical protein